MSTGCIPRVVMAGVPIRMPPVTVGGVSSYGTSFLLTFMPTDSRTSCASLPVIPVGLRSTRNRCVSVPPVTIRNPSEAILSHKARQFATILSWYSLNSGLIASLKQTALAAMACINGPPCIPGNTAASTRGPYASRQRINPPLGPRIVLWVVPVTKSEYGTGSGCTPPTTNPPKWAISTIRAAPTLSAISRKAAKSMDRGYALAPATISRGFSRAAISAIRS